MSKDYAGTGIVVHWDASRCIHVGTCTRLAPAVFDVTQRPWIHADGADADTVAAVIQQCPTGALRYRRLDGGAAEQVPSTTTVVPMRNGPLFLHGPLRVVTPGGQVLAEETRLALCRCGATRNPPFCDNAHRSVGYRSSDPAPPEEHLGAASPEEICQRQELGDQA